MIRTPQCAFGGSAEMLAHLRSFASFTPSSFFLLSSTLSSTLRVYNIHTGKVLKTLRAPNYRSEKYPSPAIVFARPTALLPHTNGDIGVNGDPPVRVQGSTPAWVVAGSETGEVVIWELNSRSVVQVLQGHKSPVVATAVHPSGRWIATGSLEPEKAVHISQVTPPPPEPEGDA